MATKRSPVDWQLIWPVRSFYARPVARNNQWVIRQTGDPPSVLSSLSRATHKPAAGWLTHHVANEISDLTYSVYLGFYSLKMEIIPVLRFWSLNMLFYQFMLIKKRGTIMTSRSCCSQTELWGHETFFLVRRLEIKSEKHEFTVYFSVIISHLNLHQKCY